jgi:hypothetical protein
MSVKSQLYFWVECDGDGCDARCPSEDYDISAWGDEDQAITDAENSDWTITAAGEHYCEDCTTQEIRDAVPFVSDVRGDALPGLTS